MQSHYQSEHQRLHDFLLSHQSVRFGTFTLSSGVTSDVYVDAKLTTCHPEAMPLVGSLFLRKIKEMGWQPEAVGGLTLGADPIAMAVGRESLSLGPMVRTFIVRKEPKKHGRCRFIEGIENVEGLRVVIVDDVCTTGDSTIKAVEQARAAGMLVLGAVCLVDRESGATENLAEHGVQLASLFTLSELRAHAQQTALAHG